MLPTSLIIGGAIGLAVIIYRHAVPRAINALDRGGHLKGGEG